MARAWNADPALVAQIEERLREPVYFRDLVLLARRHPYRELLRAWSDIRERHALARDEHGRYWLPSDKSG